MTEELLKKVGADKIAEAYARITRRPCACARRRDALNNVHRAIIGRPPVTPPTAPVDEQRNPNMPPITK